MNLTEAEEAVKQYIHDNFPYIVTGSSIICPTVEANDYDIVILCTKETLITFISNFNLSYSDSSYESGCVPTDYFESYKYGHLNVIAVFTDENFIRWKLATNTAIALNPKSKKDRVALFTVIRRIGR